MERSVNISITISLMVVCAVLGCRSGSANMGTVALENTYWLLVEADGEKITTPAGGRQVYMRMTREGNERRITGFAGCNGLGGDYEAEGDSIGFRTITTKMFCELQMATENAFTQMLTQANRYAIKGKSLMLYDGDRLLGRLEATPNDPSGR